VESKNIFLKLILKKRDRLAFPAQIAPNKERSPGVFQNRFCW
jgi:hypothetical protein